MMILLLLRETRPTGRGGEGGREGGRVGGWEKDREKEIERVREGNRGMSTRFACCCFFLTAVSYLVMYSFSFFYLALGCMS